MTDPPSDYLKIAWKIANASFDAEARGALGLWLLAAIAIAIIVTAAVIYTR